MSKVLATFTVLDRILTVKVIREAFDFGLKHAKDVMDAIANGDPLELDAWELESLMAAQARLHIQALQNGYESARLFPVLILKTVKPIETPNVIKLADVRKKDMAARQQAAAAVNVAIGIR